MEAIPCVGVLGSFRQRGAACDAGTFAISRVASALPASWTAELVDTMTNERASLLSDSSMAFEVSDSTDWSARFEVQFANAPTDAEGDAAALFVGNLFPNPTTGASAIRVRVADAQEVSAQVFDALGRQVAVAFEGTMGANADQTLEVGAGLAAGVYVVRIQGATFTESRTLVVTR